MTRMIVSSAVIAALATGCTKKEPASKPPSADMEPATPVAREAEVAVEAKTTPDLAKHYDDCLVHRNSAAWDSVKACYTSGATLELPGSSQSAVRGDIAIADWLKKRHAALADEVVTPQLVVVGTKLVAAVAHVTGTRDGKRYGQLVGHLLRFDDAGKIANRWEFVDSAPTAVMEKPPGEKKVLTARGDDAEKANLAVVQASIAAFAKHDDKARAALLPADPRVQDLWKAYADLKITTAESLAAADHVVIVGILGGTAADKKLSLPFLAVYRLEGGAITSQAMYFDAAALKA